MIPAQVGWTSWSLDPVVVLALAIAGMGYLLLIGPWRERVPASAPVPLRTAVSFFAGLLVLFVALTSPLHRLGDEYLLTAHMIQHLLLVLVAPPLLLLGIPGWMAAPLVADWRALAVVRFLRQPVVAFIIFNVVFLLWHWPAFYQAALGNDLVHRSEHAMVFVAALIGWLPVFSPFPQVKPLSEPVAMLYIFVNIIPSQIIGALLALADGVSYPVYALAPRVWGLTPMMDQQVAGMIMWIVSGFYMFGVITVMFFVWAARNEKADQAARAARRAAAPGA